MRLAIASDLHLGDTLSRLVRQVDDGWQVGPAYPGFREAVGIGNDYLVLLGDVIDLSVAAFDASYGAARTFFRAVREDGLARQVIYVPGNHDFSVWNLLAQEINVIKQVRDGDPIKDSLAKPGVLREAPAAGQLELRLGDSLPNDRTGRYGGLFLDDLARDPGTGEDAPDSQVLPFAVAFPNLYFVPAEGPTVLMTHGHFFERYWSLLGEFALAVAGPDMRLARAGRLDIEEWCRINCPLNELASASLGQTGPLVPVIHQVQQEVNANETPHTQDYVDRATRFLDHEIRGNLLTEILSDAALEVLEHFAIRKLTRREPARDAEDFFRREDVQARIREYLGACQAEVAHVPEPDGIGRPGILLCGHTHQPIDLDAPAAWIATAAGDVRVLNSGGWLEPHDPGQPFPGVVFRYRTGEGFTCRRVTLPPAQGGGG